MDVITTNLPGVTLITRSDRPDLSDLPWDVPITQWAEKDPRMEEVTTGLTRHPVVFPNFDGELYAVKELPAGLAEKEYKVLRRMEELRLPVVTAFGYAQSVSRDTHLPVSALITRFLEHSLPYRTLIMRSGFQRYQLHLLDAMAGLLVQLHIAGIFWGDCSLSNTLFRPDAGALQPYLVDAETTETQSGRLEPTLRFEELEIMEENVNDELRDLAKAGELPQTTLEGIPYLETGSYIRKRYLSLYDEITRDQLIKANESYKIHERVRALNNLGYSVRQIEALPSEQGDLLRLRVIVADRNFHRDQLMNLTGVEAEENQARQIMNEILEIQGHISRVNNRPMPLSAAAHLWLESRYLPVLDALQLLIDQRKEAGEPVFPLELYIEVLEHKWYLSEQAGRDVGHVAAAHDFIEKQTRPPSGQLHS